MKIKIDAPQYISHNAIKDGNSSVSEDNAAPAGTVFIIKCDFHQPRQRVRQAVICTLSALFLINVNFHFD